MVYEEEQMRERIQLLIHRESISQREFANRLNRQPSNVSQILNGERHIPRGLATDIIQAFPRVRKDWLIFGDGTMYDGEEKLSDILHQDTRPRLPKSLSGGHITDYYDGDNRVLCQEQDIVKQFSDYDFSIILKNHVMSPKYDRGDELFFKKVTIIEWGNDYLLDTFEGPKFKKVYDAGDSYRCVSYDAEEYPEFLVPKNMVYGYYKLIGVLRIL